MEEEMAVVLSPASLSGSEDEASYSPITPHVATPKDSLEEAVPHILLEMWHSSEENDEDQSSSSGDSSSLSPAAHARALGIRARPRAASDALKTQYMRKKKRENLPASALRVFKLWLQANLKHPYPSETEKKRFMRATGLTLVQINNWFSNARRRLLPMLATDEME